MKNHHRHLLLILLFGMVLACQIIEQPLVFSPSELPDAHIGQPYQTTITVSNNRTPVFKIGVLEEELPPGLSLIYEGEDGIAEIEGTPEDVGEFEFTIYAACYGTNVNGQTGEHRYQLLVKQE
ncbi:MAG: hypothetical protein JXB07_16610 [Anaerolineae bacterium]|nr:hypothetical protein [Anaerolineae bacterium]